MPEIPVTSALSYLGMFFLISGFFLILSGVDIIKIKKVAVKPGRRTWGFGILLAVFGAIFLLPEIVNSLLLTPSLTPSATVTSLPTADLSITVTSNLSTAEATKTLSLSSTPVSTTVYISSDAFHIGDEELRDWPPLYGACFNIGFSVSLPVRTLTLQLETFGAEAQNPISLNGSEVAILPPQGVRAPNEWSAIRTIYLPTNELLNGANRIAICAGLVEIAPSFAGDKDDFQIRNVQIAVQ